MNKELQVFARKRLKTELARLPKSDQDFFIYAYDKRNNYLSINDVVDSLPEHYLDSAMAGVQQLLANRFILDNTQQTDSDSVDEYQLHACPFCGSNDAHLQLILRDIEYWVVICNTCQARGGYNTAKDEAARMWNSRKRLIPENKVYSFKSELKDLLKQYNADIYIELDGDTHGLYSAIIIDLDGKEIMRSGNGTLDYSEIRLDK